MLGVEIGKAADDVEPAVVGKFFAGGVESFDYSVGEEDQRVARLESDFGGRKCGFRRDAEGEAAGFEALGGRICATNNGGVVPCVDVGEATGGGIVFSEDSGGEALAAEAVGAGVMIEADGELAEREAFGGDGAQAGLQRGHEESGGDTFACDIGHDEHQLAAGESVVGGIEGVVIIAGDGILRTGVEGDLRVGNHWRSGGNEPGLDFASDFEIALHRDLVGEFEGEKKEEEKRGEKFVFDFDGVVVTDLPVESRNEKQAHGGEEQDAAGRSELVHHCPEELLDYGEGALPARELVDFVPIDVLAVEAIAGAGVGGELRPEVVDAAAFADALPEVAETGKSCGTRFGSAGGRCSGSSHGKSIGERGYAGQR